MINSFYVNIHSYKVIGQLEGEEKDAGLQKSGLQKAETLLNRAQKM